MRSIRVVHVCTVHDWRDVRIFQKEAASLARLGYDMHLVLPEAPEGVQQGVNLHRITRHGRRLRRMTVGVWEAFRAVRRLKGDIYGIHSPELIPLALLLRLLGRPVVYDVHEDFVTLIGQKPYLPWGTHRLLASLVRALERAASRFLYVTLAERYYARFFPRHDSLILNFPDVRQFEECPRRDDPGCRVLIYTGNVGVDRGSETQSRMLQWDSEIEVHLVGYCPAAVASGARAAAGDGVARLHIDAIDQYLPHRRIREYYHRSDLLAGLAVFPRTLDTVDKELTKFFEYMAAGLPILCSDFPVWRRLVVDNGVGLAVKPDSAEDVAAALRRLRENPAERQAMAERGRRLVREQFNWESQEKLLAGVYEKIVRRHQPGRAPVSATSIGEPT